MVDFIKIAIPYSYKEVLLSMPQFDFKSHFSHKTGEVSYNILTAKYKNFEIIITQSKIIIKGSIHIYFNLHFNQGRQNFDDFSFQNLIQAIHLFSEDFQVNINDMKIENLEFGINIKVQFNVTEILSNLFIDWDTRRKHICKDYKNGFYVEYSTVDRFFKFYDKGGHHSLPYPLLRYELKYMRNETLVKKAGIRTINDLIQPTNFKMLVNNFKEEVLKINIVDTLIMPDGLTAKEAKLFQNGINSMFWNNYPNQGLKAQESKYRRQYMELIKKLGLDTIKNEIIQNVIEKATALNAKNEI